ncbi:MAG: 3-isopropylmalate dehydratase large subunit, partial [Gammaproteobacteria bacterium]|nr:3-isopropylmalate dehydratase large subunit [Gammaproteobacteria bacterium]
MQTAPKTLFDKIWEQHVVVPETEDTPAILYIDLHLIHEVTTPQAFSLLRENNLKVRIPEKVLATMDHSTPTVPIGSLKDLDIVSEPGPAQQIRDMIQNCKDFDIELYGFESKYRGIVHVIG